MPQDSPIGIDSLKLHMPYYKIKKTSHNFEFYPPPIIAPDKEKKKKLFDVLFDTGETMECGRAEINNDNRESIQYTLNAGGIFAKVNVPNIAGNRLHFGGTNENKKAIQFIYDGWNDVGINFNRADTRISRLDMSRDIETDYQPDLYYPTLSRLEHSKDKYYYQIGSTIYDSPSKDRISCVYDKIQDLDAKGRAAQKKHQMRIEHRLLNAKGLKGAYPDYILKYLECGKQDLQDLSVLINEKKFRDIQGLHLAYNNQLLRGNYTNYWINSNKQEMILTIQNLSMQNVKPDQIINILFLLKSDINLFTLDEFADIIYSVKPKETKEQRQSISSAKYNYKKRLNELFKKVGEKNQFTYDELYQEIREKALLKVA